MAVEGVGDERGHNCPTERKEMEVDGSRAAGGSSQAGPGGQQSRDQGEL